QAGQYGRVVRLERRTVHQSSQHRHLVVQHDDLDPQVAVLTAGEPDYLEHTAKPAVQGTRGPSKVARRSSYPESKSRSWLWMVFSAPTGWVLGTYGAHSSPAGSAPDARWAWS